MGKQQTKVPVVQDTTNKAVTNALPAELATKEAADNYFAKERAKNTFKQNYAGNTRYVEGGITEYDKGISANNVENIEDLRGENQSAGDKLINGLVRATARTGLRVVDSAATVGFLAFNLFGQAKDLGVAITNGVAGTDFEEDTTQLSDAYNNPYSRWMDKIDKDLVANTSIHRTDEERDGLLASATSMGFWADTVLDGVSLSLIHI
jgi:hypothetical protein